MEQTTPSFKARLGRVAAWMARISLADPARRILTASLLLSFCCWLSCTGQARTPVQPEAGTVHLEVMTYNLNYGLAGDTAGIEAIAAVNADIVFLQETTADWERALRKQLGNRYPHVAFRHCCGAGGLGVLSKLPFVEHDYVQSTAGWFPAWRLIVQSPLGALQVLQLHLRPQVSDSGSVISGYFQTPAIRRAEIEQFHPLLDPDLPTLVVGDLNENHHGRAVAFLKQKGFRSALSEFPGSQQTWRWTTSLGTVRAELDHLLYDDRLEPLEVKVVDAGRSDHLPVVGTFQLAKRSPDAAADSSAARAGRRRAPSDGPSGSAHRSSRAELAPVNGVVLVTSTESRTPGCLR